MESTGIRREFGKIAKERTSHALRLSQGYPGVLSEINSIDAVMRYAIEELHFLVDDIVVFAWSIGGYSACWTAVNYQDIRGLVLDAVFDDVLPLAQRQMPAFASNFVEKTIRYYLDLNNVQLLKLFNGPFYLIRRTQDEIISLIPGRVETNRGNELLFDVLHYRYPMIYNEDQTLTLLRRYICSSNTQKIALYDQYCPNERELQVRTADYRLKNPTASYPSSFGESPYITGSVSMVVCSAFRRELFFAWTSTVCYLPDRSIPGELRFPTLHTFATDLFSRP